MTIDETLLRSRHTHLNASAVAREMRADMVPTLARFAAVTVALVGFAAIAGAI